MLVKPLELHPGAEDDYLKALGWYRDRNLSAAVKFEDALDERPHRRGCA
jgi:hypothetical protein